MKHKNGYWIDDNGNRWSDCISESEAQKSSESLKGCSNCYNCHYCRNCDYCDNCNNCRNCRNCRYCNNCHYCRDCYNCNNCYNCHYCDDCCDCYRCEYYTENPARYLTDRIGSRRDHTVFYFGKIENGMSLQVVCGCFRGDLKEFEAAVLKTHENSEVYRNQYLKEIAKVKTLFELEV